jgi:hypothetical protein
VRPTTPQALRQACSLPLCYDDARLAELLDRASQDGVLPVLLSLPPADARRIVAGCLSKDDAVFWARRCAERAQGYAARTRTDAATAAYAAYAARAAATYAAYADAAASAARARAYADATADATADADAAEHETALREACRLLGWCV